MKRTWIVPSAALAVALALFGYRTTDAKAAQAGAPVADRKADEAALRQAMAGFAAAFEKGDAAAAAAFLTGEAELVPEDGPAVRGREEIRKAFAAHFAAKPKAKIVLQPESVRFTSRDTALEEGRMTVTPAGGAGATRNDYSVMYVREDGRWLLAVVRESAADEVGLQDLEWLIGSWAAKRPDAEVQTTYEWLGNKSFIRAHFTVREKGKTLSGMQVIGADPATGELRTWVFEHDGGFGAGTLVRDGKNWVFEMSTTLANGGTLEAKNILVPINKDAFTWQPIDLTIDGEQFGNLAPMKVTRVNK